VLSALVVGAWIPIFAISTTVHVMAAVGAFIGPLHLYSFKIDFIATLEAIMVSLLNFRYVHIDFPSEHLHLGPFMPVLFGPDME
jgi:hypothetical protein